MQLLPFMEVTGTAVTYNREATLPAAQFYDVGDGWQEATPTFAPITTALKIMGGDADVDNFLQATYADPNDIEAEVETWTARRTAGGAGRLGGERGGLGLLAAGGVVGAVTDDPSTALIVGGVLAVVALFVVREVASGALREAGEDLWEWIKQRITGH